MSCFKEVESTDDLLGQNGVLKQLTKGLVERILEAEMTAHFANDKHAESIFGTSD